MLSNGTWTDFISDFIQFTEGALSPYPFRLWCGIALVAGALERRVWSRIGEGTSGELVTFPNLYITLVGPPGAGKYIIESVRGIWQDTPKVGYPTLSAFHVAPDSMTKASLMDRLAKAKQTFLPLTGPPITYHSMLVAAEECQVLLPDYDREYIGSLNSIWNNKTFHEESRRTGSVRELKIEFPQLNILAGAQPSYLASTFPEEFWSTGLARRIIMVYSPEAPLRDIFNPPPLEAGFRDHLLSRLNNLSMLYGQMKWTPDAVEIIRTWHLTGRPPAPTHSKLVHYNTSRTQLVIKLAIISAISRTADFVIEEVDSVRAKSWLLEAEQIMPDIFREMIGKSDAQVIEELQLFVGAVYARQKQKPIRVELIWEFLSQRLPSDKPEKVFQLAERIGVIGCYEGSNRELWIPKPRYHRGME